ncbi:MAG: alkaline phosphatase D family protein [Rhodospirillales bacterium]|nr:alkaline phosphatase D family protein [Rhodospirillales bacterium]
MIKRTNCADQSGCSVAGEERRDAEAGVSRRRVVQGAGALAGILAAPAVLRGGRAQAKEPSGLFSLGVASGDPSGTSAVLWTRLAPDPLNGGGMPPAPVPVTWTVASDPDMANVIAGGVVTALARNGHAVHAPATGLPSNAWLYYRFEALGARSRIGRTRTFPRPGQVSERMRFALVSCQNYEQGYYPAWRDIAHRRYHEDSAIDFVVHVGDYIYEGGPSRTPDLPGRVHSGTSECFTIADYRNRYAQYRIDHNLQDAHANFPFIVTPDDHEVENNYAGLSTEESGDLQGADFRARRAGAYKVYAEQMPLRLENRVVSASGNLALHRRLQFGDLADIHVLDTRQFRSDQPAGDGFGSTDPHSAALEAVFGEEIYDTDGINDPNATMMGQAQELWLADGLRQSTSRWNIIAQQVMMTRWNLIEAGRLAIANNASIPASLKGQLLAVAAQVSNLYNVDAWDGYPAARQRLFDTLEILRPNNPIFVSGDIHSAWAANLLRDFDDQGSDALAAEFVCTSISSTFLDIDPRASHVAVKASVDADNPHIPYFNGLFRGYCFCDVDHDRFRTVYRGVGDPSALASPDRLAFAPQETTPLSTDAVISIDAGFNLPGSGKRLVTRYRRSLPAPF